MSETIGGCKSMSDIVIIESETEIRAEAHGHSESRLSELIEVLEEHEHE